MLSVRNAEKSLVPGDATYVQRLEMMYLLSLDIGNNVAVAIIDQPTFVGKSTILHSFFQSKLASLHTPLAAGMGALHRPKLTFLLGSDTLVRVFSPKFYASEEEMTRLLQKFLSPDGQDCQIICAHRPNVTIDEEVERRALNAYRKFVDRERIHFIDISDDEQTLSSTQVRVTVAAGKDDWKRLVTDLVANYIIENGLYV